MIVEDLVGIILVLGVVLAENKVKQSACGVNYGQGIELVIPDYIVCLLERGALGSGDELFKRSHELGNGGGKLHARNAVVAAGNYAEKLAGGRAVLGDGHGGVAVALFKLEHILERCVGGDVRSAGNKACLVAFYASHHCRLVLYRLRAVYERYAALLCQRYGHSVV